ncbi:MAG: acyl-CoA dehydrogenase family protein, partial [Acidobacteriia bacterium]|nr:acyl-CoA dehydrogenase family protein [Terriglobia bacterium]
MDFGYTPEQNQLRKTIRDFAEQEMRPHVMEWDETQHFPLEVFKELGKLGVLGAIFPESLGGSGYSYVDYSIIMEELARVDPSLALSAAAHISLCSNHIYIAGNREQHEKYIPKLASGEWIGCWSLTEPEAGSDAGGTRSVAVHQGDQWVLNGSKTFTTNAHIADVCVAMAVTDRAASSHGISAFILDKGTPGFRPGKKENKMGMRCSPTGEVIFSDCRVADSQLCGKPGSGFIDSMRILDGGRISIAALSLG